jgi:hypothetical protein
MTGNYYVFLSTHCWKILLVWRRPLKNMININVECSNLLCMEIEFEVPKKCFCPRGWLAVTSLMTKHLSVVQLILDFLRFILIVM